MSENNPTEAQFEKLALETAIEGMKAIRAFLICQSDNTPLEQFLHRKAKSGGVAVTGYTRFISAQTNRDAVDLAARKMGAIGAREPRRLRA
jgi:hypothetical protein